VSFTPAILPGSTVFRLLLRIAAWPFPDACSATDTALVHCGRFACMATEVENRSQGISCLPQPATDRLLVTDRKPLPKRADDGTFIFADHPEFRPNMSFVSLNNLLLLRCKKKMQKTQTF
jgi:hypothetical protein